MRRVRRSSFGSGTAASEGVAGVDQKRRIELLAEARRKRVAWVEEARGVDEGIDGARRRREDEAAENGRKAEGELERLFPSAVKFHDFLSGLAGDPEESPAGDLSAILQPFMIQDVDIGDDRPIPSHKDGVKGYDIFLDKLRHPRAAEVVKTLQQFVAAFKARAEGVTKQLSSPGPRGMAGTSSAYEEVLGSGPLSASAERVWGAEGLSSGGRSGRLEMGTKGSGSGDGVVAGVTAVTMSGMMHAFLGRVETQMRESALWRRETPDQWEETRESLERIVLHKVFDQAYGLAADKKRDEAIRDRLCSLGFLTEEHLGVPALVDSEGDGQASWSDAEAQLSKMAHMRCPGDMLHCILECTHTVAGLLTGNRASGVLPGADEFLPALILLVKKANPPNIHSNLEFIQSFRDPSKLLSEAGYVLTQVVSAVCFLEEVDASVLSIAHGEFERGLKGFQETAREGLQAHQLKVKEEEEHARFLHTSSQKHHPNGYAGASTSSGSSVASAVAAGLAISSGGTPSHHRSIPAKAPQREEPRDIGAAEVRAKRLAGLHGTPANAASATLAQLGIPPSTSSSQPAVKTGTNSARPRSRRSHHHEQRYSIDSEIRDSSGGGRKRVDSSTTVSGQLRFVGCTAAELRMSELPALLAEHQHLARLCEELLAERGLTAAVGGHRRRRG